MTPTKKIKSWGRFRVTGLQYTFFSAFIEESSLQHNVVLNEQFVTRFQVPLQIVTQSVGMPKIARFPHSD